MDVPTAAKIAFVVWAFVLGASIGSFLNVVIYRVPLGMSLSKPPSACPSCGHPVRWRDNLPILSWLLLRGRCRDCRHPIGAIYPAVEAAVGLWFAAAALVAVSVHDGRPIVLAVAVLVVAAAFVALPKIVAHRRSRRLG
jgi:leader peptidase (prepilin peptidase)/N-methyltransferase